MKLAVILLPLVFLGATSGLLGQSPRTPTSPAAGQISANGGAKQTAPSANPTAAKKATKAAKNAEVRLKPFSRIALGGGFSLMGVNLQAATNVNRYLNLRATGNIFNYTVNNINVNGSSNGNSGISSDGLNLSGKVNFATAGASLDYYPFPKHGLRLSPGMLFYNENQITANAVAPSGNSFTLNGDKYYSEAASPLNVNASLGLNTRKQAFSMTTGWGNMIPRKRKETAWSRFSFPFEIGAVFTGVPTINMNLSGYACANQADAATNGATCVNMATNTTAQNDLNTQLTKWKSDLNPLQVYPIFSFGVAYEFHGK